MESNHVRDLMEAYSSIYTENEEVEQLDEFAPRLQGPVDRFLKGGQKVLKGLGLKVNEKERPTPDQNAQKAKINQNQSFDLFDIIKGHLLDEGFADTEEAALAIMTNMSEDWKQSIVEQDAIVRTGTSTNAAGEKIPWRHTHNSGTGKSSVTDKFGTRDVTVRSSKLKGV